MSSGGKSKIYGWKKLNTTSIVDQTQNDLQTLTVDLCKEYLTKHNIKSCIQDINSYISHIFHPSQSSFNLSKTDINNRMIGFLTVLIVTFSIYLAITNESQSGYDTIGWIMISTCGTAMLLFIYLILFTSTKLHQYRVHLINIGDKHSNSGIYIPIEFISKPNYVTTSISDLSSMRGSTTQKLLTAMANILSIFGISACIMKICEYKQMTGYDTNITMQDEKFNVVLLLFAFIGPLLLGNFEINNQTGSYKERKLKQTVLHFSGVVLFVVIGPYSYWRFKNDQFSFYLFLFAVGFCVVYMLMRCCSLEIRDKVKIFQMLFDCCCYWIRTRFEDEMGNKKESLFVKYVNNKKIKTCGCKMSVKRISLMFIFMEIIAVSIAAIACILFVMELDNIKGQ